MLNQRLQKALGRKDELTNFWLELGKAYGVFQIKPEEQSVMNKSALAYINGAGLSGSEVAASFIKAASLDGIDLDLWYVKAANYDSTISSVFSPKAGTENFTNLRSPGASEAKIEAEPGRSGKNTGRADDAFVGASTSDRKHNPSYPQKYSAGREGWPSDELTIGREDYTSQRQISGSSEDVQGSRARYKEPGAAVRGERQPDFQVLQGRGASGTYGRGTFIESIKNAKEQELAKSASRVLSPERLQAFRYGKPIPVRDPTPEMRKSVLTKGIVDKLTTKEARRLTDDEEQGGAFGAGSMQFGEESAEESYEPSLTKLDEDEAKLEEATRLDDEAKVLQERGFVEESIDRRAKAMKIRATISKAHFATTMKAHLQAGREPI